MACSSGPSIVTDELVFAIDSVSQHSISALGCTGFNNAPQLIKNIVSQSDTITSNSNTRIDSTDSGFNFYTIFAIDYPEGNYGGSAAGRDGITPGFNVTSGTKTEDYNRALNYRVWNEDTEDWVPTSYHNGDRNSGRCYDTFSSSSSGGAAGQVALFVQDYNTIKQAFPRSIHIVAGSHRDSNHSNDQYDVLRDLGAPDNVNTIINFSSPEWILVGRPGLGAGNAYGWAFQNYSTNSSQVAHMNMSLPVFRKEQYLNFNGSSDYIDAGNLGSGFNDYTVIAWFYPTSVTNHENVLDCNYSTNSNTGNMGPRLEMNSSGGLIWIYSNSTSNGNYYGHSVKSSGLSANTWHCAAITYTSTGNTSVTYYNGSATGLGRSTVGSPSGQYTTFNDINIGRGFHLGGGERYYTGRVGAIQIYKKTLSAAEVAQNFNALRGRFGI